VLKALTIAAEPYRHRRCAGLGLACAHDAAELVTDEVAIRTAGGLARLSLKRS
jgi:hypothetical protein